MVLNTIVDIMCTNGIEYYCRHYAHKANGVGKKINRVNTMTTIETISWSKILLDSGKHFNLDSNLDIKWC